MHNAIHEQIKFANTTISMLRKFLKLIILTYVSPKLNITTSCLYILVVYRSCQKLKIKKLFSGMPITANAPK